MKKIILTLSALVVLFAIYTYAQVFYQPGDMVWIGNTGWDRSINLQYLDPNAVGYRGVFIGHGVPGIFGDSNPAINIKDGPSSTQSIIATNNAADDFIALEVNANPTLRAFSNLTLQSEGNVLIKNSATPSITSGFGTSPSIAGNDNVGRVTIGTLPGTSGVVTFSSPFANAPICLANDETTSVNVRATATTTTLTLNGVFLASDKVTFVCIGYR